MDTKNEGGAAAAEEKSVPKTLFNDLEAFRNRQVTISFYGGESVSGRLLGFDDVANCILKTDKKRMIVIGKSIAAVCEGLAVVL